MASKKRSGPTQPEARRTNQQLLLRLAPVTTEHIRALARAHGVTASHVVTVALALAGGRLGAALSLDAAELARALLAAPERRVDDV